MKDFATWASQNAKWAPVQDTWHLSMFMFTQCSEVSAVLSRTALCLSLGLLRNLSSAVRKLDHFKGYGSTD